VTGALPFGIDIGSRRVRVAVARRDGDGRTRLEAVATRDLALSHNHDARDAEITTAIAECVTEAGRCRGTCVLAIPSSEAAVRRVAFPAMSRSERQRAASFEAARFVSWDVESVPTEVRVTSLGEGDAYAVGAVPREYLQRRLQYAKRVHLKTIAVDYEPFAAVRAATGCDAVLDVGYQRTRLYGCHAESPAVFDIDGGGEGVTQAISSELSIEKAEAERRKRSVGIAGAGEEAFAALLAGIRVAIERMREVVAVKSIAVIGNGGRLAGFAEHLSKAAAVAVAPPSAFSYEPITDRVAMTDQTDWALALALAGWPCR
jgi:Tfp pilus assembly PilM family ATPase